jgi:curved DNA-binding protein CbpA
VNGSLGKKLISDLIRDIGNKGSNGLLRVSNGKTIKAIFFEAGVPVYAISNIASEQIENILMNEGLATREQIDAAKERAGKSQKLGRALVDMGIVGESDLARVSVQSARTIILSLFELTRGDYSLDERVRAAHEVKLDWTVSDCLLDGGRSLAEKEEIAGAIVPSHAVLTKPRSTGRLMLTGRLSPTESYVYSRVENNIQLSELAGSTGLPDEECRRAVLALTSLGLLKVEGRVVEDDGEIAEDEDPADQIADDISRMIHFFSSADYYEVLGVTLRSSSADIKTAYYKLAKKYHPDRFRQPEQADLRSKVEALFAKVTEAYETLNDPIKRSTYDDRLRKGQIKRDQSPSMPLGSKAGPSVAQGAGTPKQSKGTGPLPPIPSPAVSAPAASAQAASGPAVSVPAASAHAASHTSDSAASDSAASPPLEPDPQAQQVKPATPATPPGPGVTAEFCYNQGKARLEHKDYYGAVSLLREAVRLDGAKGPYHFHLGMALMRNPRTRREGEQHLMKAAELEPFNAQIRLRLGLIYKEAGLPKKAENYFREALQIDPENRAAQKELNGGSDRKDQPPLWKSDLGSLAKRIFKK